MCSKNTTIYELSNHRKKFQINNHSVLDEKISFKINKQVSILIINCDHLKLLCVSIFNYILRLESH